MRGIYDFLANVRLARMGTLAVAYASGIVLSLWLAYELRFDFRVPGEVFEGLLTCLGWITVTKWVVLFGFGQFEDSLSYFSTPDLKRLTGVCVTSAAIIAAAYKLGGISIAPPRGVILMEGVLWFGVLCVQRLSIRFVRERFVAPQTRPRKRMRRVGIIGAGDTGTTLARELMAKGWLGMRPVAFFDDFRRPRSRVHGIPVWGKPERLLEYGSDKLDEVVIALPSAPGARKREIIKILQQANVPFRTIPSLTQIATGNVSVTTLRAVQIEDLLGRDVIQMDADNVRRMIVGRVVLVTGAGGSIGSELCRQIVAFKPNTLLMIDRSEAALFPVEQELIDAGYRGVVVPLVADVLDRVRMEGIFSLMRPQAVFHAAAHKHVPMMESQPAEAIRNNVLGTAQMAELAYIYKVERFLLISTDKAINPTSVMGATKRMAERFVQSMQTRDFVGTAFVAVRFGNVLGSSGSVVPIFTRQIAGGGPVKVTHPEVTRFFMTIPESVSLVLQSAARARGGEIFVLDMGKPVKIAELARQMIELSGLKPGADIEIEYTGLRPGEKLYEELSHRGENVSATDHPKILRLVCEPGRYDLIAPLLDRLSTAVTVASPQELKLLLKALIPEYVPELDASAVQGLPEDALRYPSSFDSSTMAAR